MPHLHDLRGGGLGAACRPRRSLFPACGGGGATTSGKERILEGLRPSKPPAEEPTAKSCHFYKLGSSFSKVSHSIRQRSMDHTMRHRTKVAPVAPGAIDFVIVRIG